MNKDLIRSYLMSKIKEKEVVISNDDISSYEENREMALLSQKLIKEKDEDFLKLLVEVPGEELSVLKDIDTIWLESIYDPSHEETHSRYTNGEWLVVPNNIAFPLIDGNTREQLIDKEWKEISADRWGDALDALPPRRYETIGEDEFFFCAEATAATLHQCYAQVDGKYFSACKDARGAKYEEFREEIKSQNSSGKIESIIDGNSGVITNLNENGSFEKIFKRDNGTDARILIQHSGSPFSKRDADNLWVDIFSRKTGEKNWTLISDTAERKQAAKEMGIEEYLKNGRNPIFNVVTTQEILKAIDEYNFGKPKISKNTLCEENSEMSPVEAETQTHPSPK